MSTLKHSIVTLLLAVALAAAPGCMSGGSSSIQPIEVPAESVPVEARMTVVEATAIAETALVGLNEGDFEMFSTAWSPAMRAGVDAGDFGEARAQTLALAGRFVEITDVRVAPGSSPEYVRFYFLCEFESREMVFLLAFHVDGSEVVGTSIHTVAE